MNARTFPCVLALFAVLATSLSVAQWRRGRGGEGRVPRDVRTAREADSHSNGTPEWQNAPAFKKDVFTFVRIRYTSHYRLGRGDWRTDFPDSDLNFSFRLQQMTSIKVDPNGLVLDLTDPALFDYPWIYFVEPGGLEFTDEEVPILRRYLLNGGFMMADDFWGEPEWENLAQEMKRVFPEREFQESTRCSG